MTGVHRRTAGSCRADRRLTRLGNLTSRTVFALRDPNLTVGIHLAVAQFPGGRRPAPSSRLLPRCGVVGCRGCSRFYHGVAVVVGGRAEERDVDFAVRQASSWSLDESDHQGQWWSGWPASQVRISTVWRPSADHENPTRSCEQALVAAIARPHCVGCGARAPNSTCPAVVSWSLRVVRSTKRANRWFSS